MADAAKIMLSETELALVQDPNVILTKRNIINAASVLLGEQVNTINQVFGAVLSVGNDIRATRPKISKGENYNSLPYVLLDHPAIFSQTDIFALRSFFWWGHDFIITLHLSGKYLDQYKEGINKAVENNPSGLYLCINSDPWQHEVVEGNYVPAHSMNAQALQEHLFGRTFIKIAVQLPLKEWNSIPWERTYRRFAAMFSFPTGETDPSPGIPKVDSDL